MVATREKCLRMLSAHYPNLLSILGHPTKFGGERILAHKIRLRRLIEEIRPKRDTVTLEELQLSLKNFTKSLSDDLGIDAIKDAQRTFQKLKMRKQQQQQQTAAHSAAPAQHSSPPPANTSSSPMRSSPSKPIDTLKRRVLYATHLHKCWSHALQCEKTPCPTQQKGCDEFKSIQKHLNMLKEKGGRSHCDPPCNLCRKYDKLKSLIRSAHENRSILDKLDLLTRVLEGTKSNNADVQDLMEHFEGCTTLDCAVGKEARMPCGKVRTLLDHYYRRLKREAQEMEQRAGEEEDEEVAAEEGTGEVKDFDLAKFKEDNDLWKIAEVEPDAMEHEGMSELAKAPIAAMSEAQRIKELWEESHVMTPPLLTEMMRDVGAKFKPAVIVANPGGDEQAGTAFLDLVVHRRGAPSRKEVEQQRKVDQGRAVEYVARATQNMLTELLDNLVRLARQRTRGRAIGADEEEEEGAEVQPRLTITLRDLETLLLDVRKPKLGVLAQRALTRLALDDNAATDGTEIDVVSMDVNED